MTSKKFKDFLSSLVLEELHPELHSVVTNTNNYKSKQTQLANKIKDLTSRGEKTGIEGNMPKGSSRAYLKHEEPEHITLDGKPAKIPVGTKVAIKATLDNKHDKSEHDGLSLGALQNRAEHGDHWVNQNYRILTKGDKEGEYHSNHESGIFPPLIHNDEEHHEWSKVGHARDIKAGEFNKLTKTDEHPKGISHKEFTSVLNRSHNRDNGKHWDRSPSEEKHMDHIEKHPLVQKFIDYHGNTGNSPSDYEQKKNLGVFEHPDGTKHIVARDHGFDLDVQKAYMNARKKPR